MSSFGSIEHYPDDQPEGPGFGFFVVCILLVLILLTATFYEPSPKPKPEQFTRVCAWNHSTGPGKDPVCNDYPGWLEPHQSGCVDITITEAPSLICGDYTLEHRTK